MEYISLNIYNVDLVSGNLLDKERQHVEMINEMLSEWFFGFSGGKEKQSEAA